MTNDMFEKCDVNSVFYRVCYGGHVQVLTVLDVNDKKEATFLLESISKFTDQGIVYFDSPQKSKYRATSKYGFNIIKPKLGTEYFTNLEDAKKASKTYYEKENPPNAKYRVSRYYDGIFETYVSGELNKSEANKICCERNKEPRYYVQYRVEISKGCVQ